MISNAYTLLIIYARIDLTSIYIYIVCLSCLLVVEESDYSIQVEVGKLNGAGIRYEV